MIENGHCRFNITDKEIQGDQNDGINYVTWMQNTINNWLNENGKSEFDLILEHKYISGNINVIQTGANINYYTFTDRGMREGFKVMPINGDMPLTTELRENPDVTPQPIIKSFSAS